MSLFLDDEFEEALRLSGKHKAEALEKETALENMITQYEEVTKTVLGLNHQIAQLQEESSSCKQELHNREMELQKAQTSNEALRNRVNTLDQEVLEWEAERKHLEKSVKVVCEREELTARKFELKARL